ncbi:hypothetical protein A3D05_00640 [Candidatus Gottesmanbacteria bacterium RIFCSPHIGHO2_02_FULL_40_24]|uniref:Glucose/Sorbosone dehydrogenase domain-containing protein n=1 Tax=Candidatus Gottesmanbacteria bacterium RIFCSPHIGHO2_01_FULL_40_15 TaxID=1798376 RepID=A0A1F5Z769_9BACT|nr:MAG: hypothetical protein A2777_01350 [Candidatus Gottesmanbacteria bacterium RIFCSPHIGHO2_01_FULL_40_15]OGG18249.1 MAG: hypothetical protein A3D05_00640 [Candidatus Gottesmanbacteria bacterium RIFCSPHIGHO2_02_FULL_40_24]OGG22915.1 MAG: hypothetical protein A3B48_01205 [Candidatus Gottesmanbacteria bacterium RIFCSPLOWO2_01_FULL_40_10]OGG31669.1 MAG: hypothetical protein A3I80_03140 [Candidatus Gottesmanbacteria bacterium RIFCSPLOWO2_02_FULL_40_10]
MKKILIILFIVTGGILFYFSQSNKAQPTPQKNQSGSVPELPAVTVIAENLETPWAIAFLPDGSMLVTERPGRVKLIDLNGNLEATLVAELNHVREIGEGGLLGIAIHPEFTLNNYVYLYYTYTGDGNNTLNRVVRMKYTGKRLSDEEIIVDGIPGEANHNGGRIKFGPDNNLYIATGDAQNPSQAQNVKLLAGKILRTTDEGVPVKGNSYENAVYSYGHRNVQGFDWDSKGNLWATEHGRSGTLSGFDELNFIENGINYGWPDIQGNENREGMRPPKRHSGASTTWAPAGAAFIDNSLFFGGLRGLTLYEAKIENDSVTAIIEHFKGDFGRLRETIRGPDGMLYISTSNRDGRGEPDETDDKIIRINPTKT